MDRFRLEINYKDNRWNVGVFENYMRIFKYADCSTHKEAQSIGRAFVEGLLRERGF